MPDAGKRFLQQIESLFRAQHADRSNKKRSIRDGSGLRRRRWVELGGVDAVIADFDSLIPDLFVDHVAAHGLAVDHYSIHHAVRPPHLAASTLVEQISAAEQARKNHRHAQAPRQRHREYGARIPGMYEANRMLPDIPPHPHRRAQSSWRLQRRYMQMKDRNTRTAELLESHPFGVVAGDVRLKSRTIELNRNLRYVPLDPTVVKLPHC